MDKKDISSPPQKTSGCLICGGELVYLPNKSYSLECEYCTRKYKTSVFCINGHYVCDQCHSKGILGLVENLCQKSNDVNPYTLAQEIFLLPELNMHGPEYHSIIPAIIVTAYDNLHEKKKDLDIKEAIYRGQKIIGGACGSHGACGAAIGVGIAYSIIHEVTPFSSKTRGTAQKLTALGLLEISQYGGPRCCKRDGLLSINVAVKHFFKAPFSLENSYVCNQYRGNELCIKTACPYFPIRND